MEQNSTKSINKLDFISLRGFYGNIALVDTNLRKKIAKLKLVDLLEQGYYKEAVYMGFYNQSEQDKATIVEFLQKIQHVRSFDILAKEFGIQDDMLHKIQKIKKI